MASKWLMAAPIAGALGVGAGVGFDRVFGANEAKQDLKPAVSLPITRVVLFNSGVGYFSRSGEIEGDARVDLTFPESDVNDLLKSMVLEDFGKGRISASATTPANPSPYALQLRDQPQRQPDVQRHRVATARRAYRSRGVPDCCEPTR